MSGGDCTLTVRHYAITRKGPPTIKLLGDFQFNNLKMCALEEGITRNPNHIEFGAIYRFKTSPFLRENMQVLNETHSWWLHFFVYSRVVYAYLNFNCFTHDENLSVELNSYWCVQCFSETEKACDKLFCHIRCYRLLIWLGSTRYYVNVPVASVRGHL